MPDMTMAGDEGLASANSFWGGNLTAAVLNGTVPQWRLDDMATRIMAAYYKVGRDTTRVPINFNSWTLDTDAYLHPYANWDYQQVNWHINVQGDHAALIRQIGAASTVLLKNTNGVLPLKKPKSVAIIGEDAHDNPGGPNSCSDRGCDIGTLAMGWGSGTANFPYLISPVTALKAQAALDRTRVANVSNNYDLDAIAAAVTGAEVAIVFANSDSGEGYITVDGNEGDRNNLTLWIDGDALVEYVASLNPNTILVLHTVGPVLIEEHKNNPNITAILWAGLPGRNLETHSQTSSTAPSTLKQRLSSPGDSRVRIMVWMFFTRRQKQHLNSISLKESSSTIAISTNTTSRHHTNSASGCPTPHSSTLTC